MTDPIADLLTRIRNAGQRKITAVDVPHSKTKERIVAILKDENYIESYKVTTNEKTGFKTIHIVLRYAGNTFVIENIKRISKPGIRRYIGYDEIPRVLGGIGFCILSTSHGIMTGDEAKKQKIGGELMCTIY